jgi:hypothetical protein
LGISLKTFLQKYKGEDEAYMSRLALIVKENPHGKRKLKFFLPI